MNYQAVLSKLKFFKVVFILLILIVPDGIQAQNSNWEVPKEAQEIENTLEKSERILNGGKQIFVQLCSVCHGKVGAGDGITAAALNPKPADLTSVAFQEQSDGTIYYKIREGRPPMPGFKTQLSEQQTWAIVHFIRSLKKEETKSK
ncbi:MAG: cytochrome c [Balneola sp.]